MERHPEVAIPEVTLPKVDPEVDMEDDLEVRLRT